MIESLTSLLSNPLFWKIVLGYWIFSALIGPMPRPTEKSHWVYVYAFGVLHTFGGNLNRAALVFKLPGAKEEEKETHGSDMSAQ